MENVCCIFCKDETTTPYREENGYQAVQCSGCGLVFVNPRPSIEEMKQLYEGQETKINLSAHLLKRDLKSIQARKNLSVLRKYCASGRLLEVGSAAGYFLWEAKKAGFDVQGVDLTHQFVEFSKTVLQVPSFEGTMKEVPFEAESFDAVFMRNLLSHMAYPLDEFRNLNRLLKKEGILVLETGNAAELTPEQAGFLELPDHLYHFSEKTIVRLLEDSGFEWVATHRFSLLSEMHFVKKLEALFQRPKAGATGPKKPLQIPTSLPASKLGARLTAHAGQFIRYDLGRVLPKEGHRCTLVMVGRKR